jgi:hypothetical protein
VHNRATTRVADRTDVSGRATADEVNFDRFHNRVRKVRALVAATFIPSSLRLWDGTDRASHIFSFRQRNHGRRRSAAWSRQFACRQC